MDDETNDKMVDRILVDINEGQLGIGEILRVRYTLDRGIETSPTGREIRNMTFQVTYMLRQPNL
jgi:hypothetical protein